MSYWRKKITATRQIWRETYRSWLSNNPFQTSAALSYYALFFLPALLILAIRMAGAFFRQSAVRSGIITELEKILGFDAASMIDVMLKQSINLDETPNAILIAVGTLFYGATGLFISMQKALNAIWGVRALKVYGLYKIARDRLFSIGLVFLTIFLFIASLICTTIINITAVWVEENFPHLTYHYISTLNHLVEIGIFSILFILLFKILPDVYIKWRHVWLGGIVTAFLFSIGKFALSYYFTHASPGSAYGAAQSIILVLLWLSYSCLMILFGAQFTKVITLRGEEKILPTEYAELIDQ